MIALAGICSTHVAILGLLACALKHRVRILVEAVHYI
jgi:hypothetical protein